jgi:nucleotide-binding universal stress UspA family protein
VTSEEQQHIVCAVRGGPESRETVTRAIELALARDARLTFFRVMDAEFLEHATVAPLSVIYRELENMAEFAIRILCDRAERKGVKDVDCLVRAGNIQRQIREFVAEQHIDLVVMGRPVRSPGSNVFKPAAFDTFVADLEQAAGVRVEVVTPSPQPKE